MSPNTGAQLYAKNCVRCHGASGAGDGPEAGDLPLAPANLRDLAANNGGVFPADRVIAAIHGYPGKQHLALMPDFGPGLSGPTVLWTTSDGQQIETPAALVELTRYIEGLQDI